MTRPELFIARTGGLSAAPAPGLKLGNIHPDIASATLSAGVRFS